MFSKKIESIFHSNKIIFKIKNFLDWDLYKNIQNNFPIISSERAKLTEDFGGKSVLSFSSDVGDKFILSSKELSQIMENTYLKQFHDIVLSDDFFNFFTKSFFFKASFIQQGYKRKLKYLRPIKRVYQADNSGIFNSKIILGYEYSYIKNNGQIVPHVDALRKYQSLMLYFPDLNFDDNNYGTSFWGSKERNWDNIHLENKEDRKNFKNKNKIIYQTPFEENCLYGFLRNDYSWHSVEPNDINKEYVRKSININFYYTN